MNHVQYIEKCVINFNNLKKGLLKNKFLKNNNEVTYSIQTREDEPEFEVSVRRSKASSSEAAVVRYRYSGSIRFLFGDKREEYILPFNKPRDRRVYKTLIEYNLSYLESRFAQHAQIRVDDFRAALKSYADSSAL